MIKESMKEMAMTIAKGIGVGFAYSFGVVILSSFLIVILVCIAIMLTFIHWDRIVNGIRMFIVWAKGWRR